jgi:hypothetical protein
VTIRVPEDFATIPAAITAAASGDTIDIAPGVYTGAIILNKSVTLRGRFADPTDPRINTTILEASASQDVITIPSGVTPAPTIAGLVLRSGLSGVSLKSPAVIEGNSFVGNNDQLDYKVGGGGFCRGNVFQDAYDDGIDINHPVRDLTIENNVMTNSDGDGVEMRLNDDTIAVTAHIVFRNNGVSNSSPMTSSAVTVANTNPTFNQSLSDRSNAEGNAISLSASASDPDEDPLTYGATGLPPGLTIDAGSGLISGSVASGAAGSSPYAVEVTVGDGTTVDATDVFTWVVAAPGSTTVRIPVAASTDDAEEFVSGAVDLNSNDLELVLDGARGNQTVGMRFTGVAVPPQGVITDAYVQFQVDRATSVATSLTIRGQAADNPATFAKTTGNISARPRATQFVLWDPVPPWSTIGAAGPDQRTPDLSSVVQEVVNRPGWTNGNAMVIIITGSGKRAAESFDGGLPRSFTSSTAARRRTSLPCRTRVQTSR